MFVVQRDMNALKKEIHRSTLYSLSRNTYWNPYFHRILNLSAGKCEMYSLFVCTAIFKLTIERKSSHYLVGRYNSCLVEEIMTLS